MADFFGNAAASARQKASPPEVRMAYFDLFSDGRLVPNDSLGFHLDPSPLFPRLPQDARQARLGWEETGRNFDSALRLQALSPRSTAEQILIRGPSRVSRPARAAGSNPMTFRSSNTY